MCHDTSVSNFDAIPRRISIFDFVPRQANYFKVKQTCTSLKLMFVSVGLRKLQIVFLTQEIVKEYVSYLSQEKNLAGVGSLTKTYKYF